MGKEPEIPYKREMNLLCDNCDVSTDKFNWNADGNNDTKLIAHNIHLKNTHQKYLKHCITADYIL